MSTQPEPSTKLSRSGRIRRFRKLARRALELYGLNDARLTFLAYEGNTIYRADVAEHSARKTGGNLYVPGRYVARVHMDYHSLQAIESELQWLLALRRDANLPVPEPIAAADGNLVIELPLPGGEGARRKCSVLRWVDGRFVSRRMKTGHIEAWGKLMAHLHNHAAGWTLPENFVRPRRDWDGLFADAAGFEHPALDLWKAIPKQFEEAFQTVVSQLRDVMSKSGTGPDVFGLVHADLMINTNILFKRGEARVIDFDDCCFAYWMHDLAFAFSSWQGDDRQKWIRDTFLKSYSEIRTLPDSQLKYLDLFLAAFNANLMLWMLDWAQLNPGSSEPTKFINKYGSDLLRYLSR